MGAALVAPVRALRAADTSQGKTGSDLALLIAIAFVVTRLPDLVSAGWIGYEEGVGVGFTTLLGSLSASITSAITLLFIATVALTLVAGRRRSLGRDFDLTCTAMVPFVTVELAAYLVFTAAGVQPRGPTADIVRYLAYGWTLVVLVLAWQQTRARSSAPDAGEAPGGGE